MVIPPPPFPNCVKLKHRLLPALLCLALTAAPSLALAANTGGSVDTDGNYVGINGPSGNTLLIDTADPTITGNFYGGFIKTGNTDSTNNIVTVNGGNQTFSGSIYGGYSDTGNATGNTLTINSGTFDGDIFGGCSYGTGDATGNTLTINSGTFQNNIYGGLSDTGNATGNTLTINSGTFQNNIYGGYSFDTGNATGNTLTINSGTFQNNIYGGYSFDTGNATGNTLTINSGTFKYIYGGYSSRGDATGNTLTINSGTFKYIHGGYSNTGNATGNTLTINSGTFQNNIYGGLSDTGNATGNTLTINSGTFDGDIFGGKSSNGNATDNTVTIMGGTFQKDIYGGSSGQGTADVKSGNTLNLHAKGITANNVKNFSTYNFYLPSDIQNGDTMLTLNDSSGTDLSGASINAEVVGGVVGGVAGDAPVKGGDTVTLIHNDNGLTTAGTTYGKLGKLTEGVSLTYDLAIAANATNTGIIATLSEPLVNSKTKSILETQAAAMSFLNSGVDRFASSGISSAKSAAQESSGSFSPFASVGGDSMRYDSGSHADVKGITGSIGMAKTIERSSGSLTFGPFIEGGRGSYDSYLDDGTHADGDTDFYGLGFFARQDRSGGSYVEGSLRLGRMSSDYASGDLVNAAGETTRYDTDSPYYGFHLGIGQVRNIGANHTLDLYGKYFYSRQNTEDTRLSSGESYDFDSVDSNRLRIGARYANAYSKTHSTYVGVAYEYEFSGKAGATYKGYDIPSPSLKGGSAMLELGYVLLPAQDGHMSADIALTGWTGQKEGVGLNARLSWGF